MREIRIKLKDKDYLDFAKVSNDSGLLPDEKLQEIIEYYLIIERNRKKYTQTLLR